MPSSEPTVRNPEGLIPLTPFSKPMGVQMQVWVDPFCWEDVVRHSPYDVSSELNKAITNALNEIGGVRADREYIDFKYWVPSETGKSRRTRLRAQLLVAEETGPWILLQNAPERFLHGVSVG